MTATAEDYPYLPNEPWTRVHQVTGLEKLRYVRDRELAQTLFELHGAISENERMMDVLKRAHSGMLGHEQERLAHQWFGETLNAPPMAKVEQFIKRIQTMRQAKAGKP